jgi:tRNA (cytidine32/uridine32-2'-O)-methyltransferase
VGTSARERRIPWPVLDPRRCAHRIAAVAAGQPVAILFGREDRGLSNDELKLCNLHLAIPSAPEYSSLNLAVAVQIVCYELRMLALEASLPESAIAHWDAPLAVHSELERMYAHFEQTLSALGFLDPAAPRQLMQRLRRLYSRAQPDLMEVNILRGILSTTDKWIAAARGEGPLPPLPDTVPRRLRQKRKAQAEEGGRG